MAYVLPRAALRLRVPRRCFRQALAPCLLLAMCVSPMAHACEPAGLDWQALYRDNDRNRNGFFEPAEWPSVIRLDSQPVAWEDEATSGDPNRWQVFKALDHNGDRRLDKEEMNGIYGYFSDPCTGWPGSR